MSSNLEQKRDLFDIIITALKEHEKTFDKLIHDFEKMFKTTCFCDWCYIFKKYHKRYDACGLLYISGVCPQAKLEKIISLDRRFNKEDLDEKN